METKRTPARRAVVALLVLSGVGTLAYLAWGRPYLEKHRRWDNQNRVGDFRFKFRAIQQKFFTEDLDNNKIHDYWVDDVAGLHRFGLIDRAIAEADAQPVVPLVPKPVPWNGYLFKTLSFGGADREPRKRFAFCAFPTEAGVTGDYIYIIEDNGAPFRCHVQSRPVPQSWPSDDELKQFWAKDCGG